MRSVEKVVALLWSPRGSDRDQWRDDLIGTAAPTLANDPRSPAERVTVLVTDSDVDRGISLHLGDLRPHGVLTWWTERSDLIDGPLSVLDRLSVRVEAMLVCESRPLVDAAPVVASIRSDGFVNVAGITPKAGLDPEAFRHHWFHLHCDVAIRTQSTTAYVRNEVVRPLTPGAPRWAGVVEETFPLDALDDPEVFFDSVGDPERLARHQREMYDSVAAFLDLSLVEARPMSEYRCWSTPA